MLVHLAIRLFFSLMLLPPPRSTLFPYTTLFRSDSDSDRCRGMQSTTRKGGGARLELRLPGCVFQVGVEEDRKSTRLNSSHLGISYAVFCLKKKKSMSD